LTRRHANIKVRVAELEVLVRKDPLGRHPELHEELAKLKKELSSG
jgi:hypothetical protein